MRTKVVGLTPSFEDFLVVQTPQLLQFGKALTGNSHDAWDLVQEALARVGERWSRLSGEYPEGYVRTIMVRLNVDRFRRHRRERLVAEGLPESGSFCGHETVLAGSLMEALSTLSARQRTAIALRYVEDLPIAEIAERMNCPEGTVKSLLSRGIDQLRRHLHIQTATPERTPS